MIYNIGTLFIYRPDGSGITHTLHAVAPSTREHLPAMADVDFERLMPNDTCPLFCVVTPLH